MARGIHQVLVGAGRGDAISSMARAIRAQLRQHGESEIYAYFIDPSCDDVVHIDRFSDHGRSGDIIVYHASYGAPEITRFLTSRRERIVLVYHNITPAELFVTYDPTFAQGLQWGRHELGLIREQVIAAVADSAFNAADLASMGYHDIAVIPAGLRPTSLTERSPNLTLDARIETMFPHGFVLSVSQILPHKRTQDLVAAMHLVQWVHRRQLGVVLVGNPRLAGYHAALNAFARRLNVQRIWFSGAVDDATLATLYRRVAMFVSTSQHEGLAIPPLEAMAFGVPVIARDAGAVADTVGDAAIVLPTNSGPALFAEAITTVDSDDQVRRHLTARGYQRVRAIEEAGHTAAFVERVIAAQVLR